MVFCGGQRSGGYPVCPREDGKVRHIDTLIIGIESTAFP